MKFILKGKFSEFPALLNNDFGGKWGAVCTVF